MKEYIDNINFDGLIQNISGIGVFITSIISLITLFVLIRQRKDSFRPNVIFGDRLNATCHSDDESILRTKWEDTYPKDKKCRDFCFEILNVGIGVAENVTVYESFKLRKTIRQIKKLDKENEFVFSWSRQDLEIRTTFDDSYFYLFTDRQPRELGTFTKTRQKKPNKYVFLDSYLALLSCLDYLRNKDATKVFNFAPYPNCNFKIEYTDIEGKKYKAKYVCKVESLMLDDYTFTFIKK